jgi:hypothetical protein
MEQEELEISEIFRQLTPENKLIQLSLARATYTAQENTKRHYGLPDLEPPTQAGKSA